MELARPGLSPDPSLDHDAMLARQRAVARAAQFRDDVDATPAAVALGEPLDLPPLPADAATSLEAGAGSVAWVEPEAGGGGAEAAPLVAGVDQAFRGDEAAVSAVVVLRGETVVARAASRVPLDMPYVPGLLAFREAGAIVAALEALPVAPDLLVLDGSGRIHYRQAGLATHVGVLFDVPAVGVAKRLLCGTPAGPDAGRLETGHLAAGERVPIAADDEVEALGHDDPDWPTIGHAVQTRQFPDPERRHVNPLYVSPGHRLRAETAAALVDALAGGYKLPEPTRLADSLADDLP